MTEHEAGPVLCLCACGARVRVPADKVGRKATCPKCGRIGVLRPAPPTAETTQTPKPVQRTPAAATSSVRCWGNTRGPWSGDPAGLSY